MEPIYTESKCKRCRETGVYVNGGVCYGCGGSGIARIETPASIAARAAFAVWRDEAEARMSGVRRLAGRQLSDAGIRGESRRSTLRSIALLGEAGQ